MFQQGGAIALLGTRLYFRIIYILPKSGRGASGRAVAVCPNKPSLITRAPRLFSLSIYEWNAFKQVPPDDAMLPDLP